MTTSTILQLENISKSFLFGEEQLKILDNIDLSICRSETVAITGPSGSGKSTLLGIMAGLEFPSSGKVIFEGKEIQNNSDEELCLWRRNNVGFIFQNFRLVKTLTALENVIFPLEILGRNNRESQEKAKAILAELQLDKRFSHFPHQLSGGEKQRVAIARAYIHNPGIIFADEPTGNLDSVNAEKVLSSLLKMNEELHTTLIVVTHDNNVASKLSSKVQLVAGSIHE